MDIEVFTTRPDTLFGATYLVLSPEHKLIQEFLYQDLVENPDEINDYIKKVKNKTEIERLEGKEKTGVLLKGIMATNLAREKSGMSKNIDIPIFIADYVLSDYGTGAVMAVPAHDERDFEFAKKFNLEIIEVISGGNISKSAYINNGVLINSGDFDNVKNNDAKKSITEFVHGKTTLNYRLRD
ncbi:MAG: class I tRNA ligase family protein [Candidatus Pacebacteria bacterium]|nr:class I tRNA ligase family protein [Candidatus Paceibacterota bacterium]